MAYRFIDAAMFYTDRHKSHRNFSVVLIRDDVEDGVVVRN